MFSLFLLYYIRKKDTVRCATSKGRQFLSLSQFAYLGYDWL